MHAAYEILHCNNQHTFTSKYERYPNNILHAACRVSHKCVSNFKHQGIMLAAQTFVVYTQFHGSKDKQNRLFCNQSNESCINNNYFKDAIQINKSRLRLRHYLPPYTHAFRHPKGGFKNVKCTPISELSHN
jgi:hypothetical protein